jgi:hypothetical protein
MTAQQVKLLRMVADAILCTVREAGPTGAPGGVIYAALMAQGCSLHQYEQIMGGLVAAGMLTRDGDCYHAAQGVRS